MRQPRLTGVLYFYALVCNAHGSMSLVHATEDGGSPPKAKMSQPIAFSTVREKASVAPKAAYETRYRQKQLKHQRQCTFCIMGQQVNDASKLNLGRRK